MYYKIINDRKVFSDGKTLYIEAENRWVSNPPEEMIFAEGWAIFVPPAPQPQTEPYSDDIITAVKTMLASSCEELSDEDALAVAALFPTWASKIGEAVTAGERLWYDTKLYKVLQPHTVQEDWTPDTAVSLFVEVSVEEWPPIPEVITAEQAYMAGDKGTWKGQHYICQIDNTVHNPDQYPAAWKLV